MLLSVWLAGCSQAPSTSAPVAAAGPTDQTAGAAVPAIPPTPPAPLATAASSPADAAADSVLQQASSLKADGKWADARALLQPLATDTNAPDKVLELLGEIDSQILFSPAPAPEKVDYTIVAGDSLGKLAKRFNTTIDLIKKANGLNGDVIRIGDRLRIYQCHFTVDVNKTANTLTVSDNGKFFKRYRVGTGQFSKTPEGEFKTTSRMENPPWYRSDGRTIPYGDPENILGTHWLGLNVPGYGIHGTWDTNSIGKQSSAGCIRLLNDDVAELYVMLPIGTPVTIHD
jgi:lipoprotein-anchoring transpeptidase ErfK/SrfK